jgi:hypothetical protein
MKKLSLYISAVILAFVSGCTYDFPEKEQPTAGSADFTKYVAIGNSLTAGYMDGALYNRGQQNSWPSILATQMKIVGGGDFNQPDINSENGYYAVINSTVYGRLILKYPGGDKTKSPTPSPIGLGDVPAAFTGDKTALNNFGVPGLTIQTAQLAATGGPATSNPYYNVYYARFASNPGTSTVIGDASSALTAGGTFFTFWLGNNDVLGYATGGGSNPAILTANGTFTTAYNAAINAVLAANTGTKGAVANIPDVTTIPFFTTVKYNAIPLDAATASYLNTNLSANYNAFLQGMVSNSVITQAEADKRKLNFVPGQNAIVIDDETLTDLDPYMAGPYAGLKPYRRARQTTATDYLTLTSASILGTTVSGSSAIWGLTAPLTDQYVLVPTETTQIQASITSFNSTIAAAVTANSERLVLVDVFNIFKTLTSSTTGITLNGIGFTASIAPPYGGFSLDGVHPNGRGSAYIANRFIEAINGKWGSSIPYVNENNYPGNDLPQ